MAFPLHMPKPSQVSDSVQGLPSVQPRPVLARCPQAPVDGSQASSVQALPSSQETGVPTQLPPLVQVSPLVQGLASLHAVPGCARFWQAKPNGEAMHWSRVQVLLSLQSKKPLKGVHGQFEVPLHSPPLHASAMVHRFPSSQALPSARGLRPQAPDPGSHAPSLHASPAQNLSGPPTQVPPASQASLVVQGSPSLQAVPASKGESRHAPVAGSQAALWHASPSHSFPVPLAQAPDPPQTSSCVHALPSSQGVPAGAVAFLQDCVASWHWPTRQLAPAQGLGPPGTQAPLPSQ